MKLLVPTLPCSLHLSGWTGTQGVHPDPVGVECHALEYPDDAGFPCNGFEPYLHVLAMTEPPEVARSWALSMLAQTLVPHELVAPDYTNFNELSGTELARLRELPWVGASLQVDDLERPVDQVEHSPQRWACVWASGGRSWVLYGVDVPRDAVALRQPTDAERAALTESAAALADPPDA